MPYGDDCVMAWASVAAGGGCPSFECAEMSLTESGRWSEDGERCRHVVRRLWGLGVFR